MQNRLLQNYITPLLLVILGLISFTKSFAQDSLVRKNKLVFLPFPFYYPETRFGVAAGAIYPFRFRNVPDSQRPSQVQIGGGYTQNRQIISYVNSQLYTRDLNYSFATEFGYYRYFYPFSGVGNGYPVDQLEIYSVQYPRLRFTALKKITTNFFAGLRLFYDNYQIMGVESGKLLASGRITGSSGGVTFSPGIAVTYDSRDNYFSARKGALIETVLQQGNKDLISDFDYTRFYINAVKYLSCSEKLTLAGNLVSDQYFGNPPFYTMAYLGGSKILRGFYDGRFRDKKAIAIQAEARYMFWRKLGVVGFADAGEVGAEFHQFNMDNLHWTFGSGLRIALDEKERIYARLDYGYTSLGYGNFYFTFFEAF